MRLSTSIPSSVTMVVAGATLVITSRMDLSRYQLAIALAAIPCFSGLLATWLVYIWKSLNRHRRIEFQIANTWVRPLSKLQTVISLSGERVELAQAELEETLRGGTTYIYPLLAIGYKCIQTCNAIHLLCARGYPDQALSICRGLMEQQATLWFIATIENKEEVTQRYLDWERAKAYLRLKDRKEGLDKRNLGPTKEEWDALNREYQRLKVKYRGNGDLGKHEQWAIGIRANEPQPVKAFSVQKRVRESRKSVPYPASDETQLHDAWISEWQRLNEFTHTTPRSILESASSNDQKVHPVSQ